MKKGGILGLFGSHEKRDADRARRLFEEALAQQGPNVALVLRVDDCLPLYITPNIERIFGVSPERISDDIETLYRFIPDSDRVRMQRQVRDWDRATPLNLLCSYHAPHGAKSQLSIRFTISLIQNGTQYLVSAVDVTTESERIAKAEAERDRAVETANARTDYMNQMSHEIRTPLNGIEGMISLAREHHADESRLMDDLSRASQLSVYLLSLINDMLDMSRLNSGRVRIDDAPFDLRLFADEIERMFTSQAADKGLTYSVILEDCENVFVVGDRMRLSQVVINFISNAVKFTERGGSVTVTLREMYRTDDGVSYMLRVRDTGKGMDPRYISKIFKPFEQEDRTIARRYGGTGLGMAITSALVDLMGGEIVVDTEPGRGSTFSAYIPLRLATPEQVEELKIKGQTLETAPDSLGSSFTYQFEGKRFLLAEDNEINAMIVIELLARRGAAVERAENGQAVVERFRSMPAGTYDTILMDIQMPVLNGWEAAEQIRGLNHEDAAAIPIIALSANDYTEDVERSLAAGMNGHVGKPIDLNVLKAQLAAAMAEAAYRGNE